MKIIIEGSDNVGKTTLIKELAKDLKDYKVISNGKYKSRKEAFEAYNEQLKNENVLIDRSMVSELVYGDYYRGNDMYEKEYFDQFLDASGRYDTPFFLITPSNFDYGIVDVNQVVDFFKKNNDGKTDWWDDYKICHMFECFWERTGRVIILKAHDPRNKDIIKEYIKKHEWRTK